MPPRPSVLAVAWALVWTTGTEAGDRCRDEAAVVAQLVPRQQTILSSEMTGRIDRLSLKEGMTVVAGQTLVVFDCAAEWARLERARMSATVAKRKYDAAKRLLTLSSSAELEAEVAAADAARAEAEVKTEAAVTSKCVIKAPFKGRVADIGVFEHQFVGAGQVLMRMFDDEALEVEFLAPSSWLSWLRPGQGLQLDVAETGTTHDVRVTRLGANVWPVSHTVKVIGEVVHRTPDLMVGMSGRVFIASPEAAAKP